ncbi:hypothetical protein BDZ94DRAFT_1194474 [Collybia nuda]|uniref:F-box domain-containing protein n=1 Tax=Collybia nuda TaxID=64659 RepID=A0A9P5Y4I7_9AGAR|nr:hypothetical protein BDZ94DRAFT_1194474 [Collybia nuda]
MEDPHLEPTQKCFCIPELVNLICNNVDADLDKPRRNATLSKLARTSRVFNEFALDYLWSSVRGIDRLIKCMPADLWEEGLTGDMRMTRPTLVFTRPIVQSDLTRLHHYARRVKTFHSMSTKEYADSSMAGMYQVLLLTEINTLLPNLHTLSWEHPDVNIFSYIRLFLAPNLAELSVMFSSYSAVQLSLLDALRQRYPSIQRLHIYHYQHLTEALRKAVETTICGLNGLHTLTVPNLTQTALEHLANLPDLKILEIRAVSPHVSYPVASSSLGFPSLRKFTITVCDDLQLATTAVEMMSSSHLRSLVLNFVLSSTPYAWGRILAAAQKNCDHTSLRRLTISGHSHPGGPPEGDPVRMDAIKPLMSFSSLSDLRLHPACGIDLDDADIRELARSWPRLKRLQLGLNFSGHPRPRVTLSSLVSLAEYCPSLHTLYMLVDACDVPPITSSRPGGVRHTNLLTLGIGGSPIDSEAGVAVFLADLFPCVDSIDRMIASVVDLDETIERWNKVWSQVDNLLPMLAAGGGQESPDSESDFSGYEEP